ncbi:transposase, partial [Cupriavidus sp. amp6]
NRRQRRMLKRRQAVEPVIGHVKADHGMRRNWLKGEIGDTVHPILCAAGFNLRWLLRAIARLGIRGLFFVLALLTGMARFATDAANRLSPHAAVV